MGSLSKCYSRKMNLLSRHKEHSVGTFRLGRRAPVPDRKTILLCVSNMRTIGTIEELKEAIRQEVAAIPPAMTRKAMDNFRERLQQYVINNSRHLSDVIFKSV